MQQWEISRRRLRPESRRVPRSKPGSGTCPLRLAVRVASGPWLQCVHGWHLRTGVVLCVHPSGDTRAHETVCRRPCGQEIAARRDMGPAGAARWSAAAYVSPRDSVVVDAGARAHGSRLSLIPSTKQRNLSRTFGWCLMKNHSGGLAWYFMRRARLVTRRIVCVPYNVGVTKACLMLLGRNENTRVPTQGTNSAPTLLRPVCRWNPSSEARKSGRFFLCASNGAPTAWPCLRCAIGAQAGVWKCN